MPILPIIAMCLLSVGVGIPVYSHISGQGLSQVPVTNAVSISDCAVQTKDKFGRCPSQARSNFRYLSVGGGGRTGGSGGSK